MDLDRGTMRQWVIGRDGVKRWADSGDPVRNDGYPADQEKMEEERNGVDAVWLCCFLREAPPGTVVRGYEGEFSGLVIEVPAENPEYEGEIVELAYIHNNCHVEITSAGKRWLTAEHAFEI